MAMRFASSHFDLRAAFVSLAAHGLAIGAIAAVSAGFGPALQTAEPPPATYMVVLAPFVPAPAAPQELPLAPPAQPELSQPSKSVPQAPALKVPTPKARPARTVAPREATPPSSDVASAHQPMQAGADPAVAGDRSEASEAFETAVPDAASQRDAEPARDALAANEAAAATAPIVRTARFRVPPTPPVYPRRAIELDLRGTTILRALVDADGTAAEIIVWTSSGLRLLDEAALAAARRWKFEPALEGTVAVAAWVEVPVRFELK